MSISSIIEIIKNSKETFVKLVSPNDAGVTGTHQGGIYLPKNSIDMFLDTPGIKGQNKDKFITIDWFDDTTSKSRVVYYGKGTRNEYRITRLGKKLKINDLIVLTKFDDDEFKGFLVDETQVAQFLMELNLKINEIDKGIVFKNNLKNESSQNLIRFEREIAATFKPRARLLIQLGDQLIKNESIAIVELVKNSYDADANIVNIYMENVDDDENGIIIIEDDGYGMSLEIVTDVWLEPGSDFKSKKIENLELTPKYKRLPIGEKGIGRFGVHKLGNTIEMTTKAVNNNEVFVKIDWTDFNDYKYLEDVPITIYERDSPQIFKGNKTGTNIVISNLRKQWERGIARGVKRSITALVSPFEAIDSFKPNFDIIDKPGWFEGLLDWKKIKEFSLFHFKVTIEGNRITSFLYEFTPWQSMPKISPTKVDIDDKIVNTFIGLEDADGRSFSLGEHEIGEITFEGYIFELDAFVLKMGVSDKSGFKRYLKENGGVRVFRNGLRVYDYGEPESDWLDLNLRRVNQPTKKISNNIVLGAVYLNRRQSSDLIEKTNREGFVENNAYKAFKASILHTIELVEILRYSDKARLKSVYGPTPKSAPVMHLLGEVKEYVDRKIQDASIKSDLTKYLVKIESDYKRVTNNLLKAAGAGLSMSVVIHEIEKIIAEVAKVIQAENSSERLVKLIKHLSSLIDGYSEIISESSKSHEDIKDIIVQALFNTEYRLVSHDINVIRLFESYIGSTKLKIARNLLIGSLMNLIDNSIFWLEKAAKGNQNLAKKVLINLSEDDKHIYIIIADNGTGFLIPTEDIVEPFVSAKPGGIGLGLHIASEIMEAQNGRLFFPDWGDFIMPEEFKDGATIVFEFKKQL
ncbi:Type II site-specific deoxyribonuclease [Flagellimonas maritima]|uniref:histidine kinase n=1 Tax=Flagellimonas maritima TaxID=1383885 RepID=A0A2Z4LW22_9FLAO|nr:ATP-binding protein [Allomuricauda aurantiaca]AWX46121.1 Type II site-specific deoxyribonuclease [Allomuricauda aurantiaca]